MKLPKVYTQAYGQIADFLKKIQDGQAPPKFTQQYLKDIGFASSNHRAFSKGSNLHLALKMKYGGE